MISPDRAPIVLLLLLCAAFVMGAWVTYMLSPSTPEPVAKSLVSAAEVSDLINRLKPLAKEPNAAWYSNGIVITFWGNGGVSIILRTKDGNEYNGRADTLKDAVSRLTDPSKDIQDALRGWSTP